jgi:hypothetical protein
MNYNNKYWWNSGIRYTISLFVLLAICLPLLNGDRITIFQLLYWIPFSIAIAWLMILMDKRDLFGKVKENNDWW